MSFFIDTVSYTESVDALREFYEEDIKDSGLPSNTTRAFSLFPETWEGWRGLVRSIRKNMRMRNYELTTFAAATELGCTF